MALPRGGGAGDAPRDLDEAVIEAENELAFADGGERLPWLESDDDFEQPGVDTGRIVTFAAAGLLAVILAVGAVWWLFGERTGDAILADGGTIEAPDEPYKSRPEDAGGRQVEGTGQTSFEVAEGQEIEGRIASSDVPVPAVDREQAGDEEKIVPVAPSGVGVQVGAYATRAAAEAGWSTLAGRFEPLQGRSHRIVQGVVDSSTIYRLQAVTGTAEEADALCRAVKAVGGDCQVKR